MAYIIHLKPGEGEGGLLQCTEMWPERKVVRQSLQSTCNGF